MPQYTCGVGGRDWGRKGLGIVLLSAFPVLLPFVVILDLTHTRGERKPSLLFIIESC